MLTRIERSLRVDQPALDMLQWCRSGESRTYWPGASNVRYEAATGAYHYDVSLSAPGITDALVSFEEEIGEVVTVGGGSRFEASQLWNWPDGRTGSAWVEYTFTPRGDTSCVLDYALHYTVFGQSRDDIPLDQVRLAYVTSAAVDRYLFYLVEYVALFQQVQTAVELPLDVGDVARFCWSGESRGHWPGVAGDVTVEDEGHHLLYECDLTVPGIPQARLLVGERLSSLHGRGRQLGFESDGRWMWPDGAILNVWYSYRFTGTRRGSTRAELTMRFVTPREAGGQPLDRARLDGACDLAARRYLATLQKAIGSALVPAPA